MIYLDNAATTPLCDAARAVMQQDFYNPSSPHTLGLEAERELKGAAKDIAEILSCRSEEIIFTSGGTESNNLGILGAAFALKSARGKNSPMRILASEEEHPSVTEPLKFLASLPGYSVIFSHPSKWEICEDTALLCIVQVSSEVGNIYNVKKPKGTVLFVDGAQGFCKVPFLKEADIYSFSGHKIHGPKGVGGLMVRKGIRLQPRMFGGGQQNSIRPGTENVQGIVAMAAAAKMVSGADHSKVAEIKKIFEEFFNVEHKANESPYILSLRFPGLRGETLTNLLSSRGICVSMGTACSSNIKKDLDIIRISFSIMNTVEEAHKAKEVIKECVKELQGRTKK